MPASQLTDNAEIGQTKPEHISIAKRISKTENHPHSIREIRELVLDAEPKSRTPPAKKATRRPPFKF